MSEEENSAFGASVFKALKAKSVKQKAKSVKQDVLSPIFRATVFPDRSSNKGKTEDMVADTGCTKTIVGAEICRELGITIRPLTSGLHIKDASGNRLNIIGTAAFYISSPQVL